MAKARDFQHGTSVVKKGGSDFLKSSGYEFQTGIVKEFIDDPDLYFEKSYPVGDLLGLNKFRDIFFPSDQAISFSSLPKPGDLLKNPELVVDMPRSSIFAYVIDNGASKNSAKPFVCYPFFPPHFSLPVKPGEHVWILKEFSGGVENYYWLCRKHSTKHVDDVNYTFFERSDKIVAKLQNVLSGKSQAVSDLDIRDYVGFSQSSQGNLPLNITNNSILLDSVANQDFTSEPVPPVTKKCGDTLIQGSNNSLIHMTTEKFETSGNNSKNNFTKVLLDSRIPIENRMPFSPAIDICVARKKEGLETIKSELLFNKVESGDVSAILNNRGSGNSTLESFEFNKIKDLQKETPLVEAGLETSALDCGSRIYLSNDCNVDSVFDTVPILSSLESVAGPSLVTYSENNRVISNNSLRLINRSPGSFIDMDSNGNIKIHSKTDLVDILNSASIYLQDGASEPYVRYSELSSLLRKILNDLAVLVEFKDILLLFVDSLLSAEIDLGPLGILPNPFLPLFASTGASAGYEGVEALLGGVGLSLANSEISVSNGNFTNITQLPTGEIETMKSTKIFGEWHIYKLIIGNVHVK